MIFLSNFCCKVRLAVPADFAGLEHGVSRGEFSHSDESPVNDVTWSPLIKTTVCWVWLPFQSFHQYNSSLSPFICGFQPKKKHSSGRGAHPKLWPPHLCPQPGDKNRLCAQSGCPVQCGRAKLPTIKTKAECMPKTGQSCLDLFYKDWFSWENQANETHHVSIHIYIYTYDHIKYIIDNISYIIYHIIYHI
jgi:hypothetical protein